MILRLKEVIIFLGYFIVVDAISSIKVDFKKCHKRNGLFPKPGSLCKAYYQCNNWVPVEWMCPSDQHFNTITGECDWMDRFHCFEKPPTKECPKANGRFLKPGTNCVYFYDCCNGKPTEKKCPQNQIFDPVQEKCEWRERYICIEDVSTDDSKTSLLFTTLDSSTFDQISTNQRETYFTEFSENPPFSISPEDPSVVSDFDQTTSSVFEKTDIPISESVTLIQTSSKEPFSPTDENLLSTEAESEFPDTQESTVGDALSSTNTYSTSIIVETTVKETFQTTTLNEETASDKIILSSTFMKETTPEEALQTTILIRETTPEEIKQSSTILIQETTLHDITLSTTSNIKTISEEIVHPSVVFKETTPKEIVPFSSTSIRESVSDETVQSTTSNIETIPEEIVSSSITFKGTTPQEFIHSTIIFKETTPDQVTQSNISIRETTPQKIGESTTLFRETSSDEIVQSTTSTRETTPEVIQFTTREKDERITTTDRVFLSTSNVLDITNEPNILCPEPFGYFPHPTDKHKFVGCVDNVPNVLTCPSDLIYNHKLKQCVYQ